MNISCSVEPTVNKLTLSDEIQIHISSNTGTDHHLNGHKNGLNYVPI